MARNLDIGKFLIEVQADAAEGLEGGQETSESIQRTDIEQWLKFENTLPAGLTDTYTLANFPNFGDPIFVYVKNAGANDITLTRVHGGGDTPSVDVIAPGGIFVLVGTTQGALVSVALTGTEGDSYTLILADNS